MKMSTLLRGCVLAAITATAAAAQPASPGAAPAPATIRESPSNYETNTSVERFIGDASRSPTRIARDVIMTRAILTAGDPLKPGPDGAVLRYRKEVVLGTMQPGEATLLAPVPEKQVIYIEEGSGRLDDGTQYWDLRPGLVLLVPPNTAHRFAATGETPLKMLMMSGVLSAAVTPPPSILVRDLAKIQYIEQGAHWSNLSKAPFNDVGERFLIVYMGPMSIAGPHSHTPDTEEGWVKLTDGPSLMMMGSEIRAWPQNVGMIAPTSGQTVHAAINTSNEVQAWFYFAGMGAITPPTPRPATQGNPNRPVPNPAIAESMVKSTVPGRPLKESRANR